MPKFITIGYGDEAGYQRLGKASRNSACQASSNVSSSGAFRRRPLAKQTDGFQEIARVVGVTKRRAQSSRRFQISGNAD